MYYNKSLPLKKWNILNQDQNKSLTEVLLGNRNLTLEHLEEFKLSERLHDPFLLVDMDRAVGQILSALTRGEKIGIFGDYDVDGIIATVLLVKFFEKIDRPVSYYLPSRQKDGYGLRIQGVQQALADKIDLLITVDNGISSQDAVAYANQHQLGIIVTDHHLPGDNLPDARAIINPNRKDCPYPFKEICGSGVVFKLLQALAPNFFTGDEYKSYMLSQLDLVAMATIADIAPIRDENYAFVKFGLKGLSDTLRPGIVELKRISGLLGKEITPTAVGYYLGPRLNAAGRLADPVLAVQLLLSKDKDEAARLATTLNNLNTKRQKKQDEYIEEALQIINSEYVQKDKIFILENENWDPGLIGIVSGKLKDRFNRPIIVFTRDKDGNFVGSARSINNFHITEALTRFNGLYLNYGGHQKAAGLTISEENYALFKSQFIAYVESTLSDDLLVPELVIDSVLAVEQLNESLVEIIRGIGPFGEGNPEPVLLLENAKIRDIFSPLQGKHLKFTVEKAGRRIECVWWGKAEYKDSLRFSMPVDVAFRPSLNLWQGYRRLQLVVEDLQPRGLA
jgi:single-stranded-DNA-specific exonuclease